MAVVQKPVKHGADGGGVAEESAQVVHGSIRGEQRTAAFVAAHDDFRELHPLHASIAVIASFSSPRSTICSSRFCLQLRPESNFGKPDRSRMTGSPKTIAWQPIQFESSLGAQAGRVDHFHLFAPVNKGIDSVRADGDLRRKSSNCVQTGEPNILPLTRLGIRQPRSSKSL